MRHWDPAIGTWNMAGPVKAEPRKASAPKAAQASAAVARTAFQAAAPMGPVSVLSQLMPPNGRPGKRQAVIHLQRTIGNRATGRLLRRLTPRPSASGPGQVQAKLTVGRADDAYEREADAAASRIESGQRVGRISRLPAAGPAPAPTVYRQSEADEEDVQTEPLQRKCAACQDEERAQRQTEEPLQMRVAEPEPALLESAKRQSEGIALRKKPLTAEERAVDLTSDAFRDDTRLQDAFDNSPVLGFGARGEAVRKIQQALVDLGFLMPVSTKDGTEEPDGVFGAETLRTVKAFQFMQGVAKDGIVGRQTLGELDGRLTGSRPPGSPPPFTVPPSSRVTVSAIDLSPQRFEKCADGFGRFHWEIEWQTNARNGYIVQEMASSQQGVFCDGSPDPGVAVSAPLFWEAWRVQQDGKVHPPPGSDTWQVPVHPFHRGTWRLTGKVFFVEQLDPQAGFQVGNMAAAQAGSLYATASKPNNLGPVLLSREAAGLWECCDDRNVHEPVEGSVAPPFDTNTGNDQTGTLASLTSTLSNLMNGSAPKKGGIPVGTPVGTPGGSGLDTTCPPGYTQCDFIDQRISVPGQFGLYELYKRGGGDCANAVAMLSAVQSSMLQGVYKADEQKPAMMAVRNGTTWWELVPPGQGAVVFDEEAPPMAVFRKNLASDRKAVATALNRAWNASELGKRSIAVVPPSLEACPPMPTPPSPSTPEPECPPGTIPDPSGDICLIPLPGQFDTECTDAEMAQQFKKQEEFCAGVKSGLDMACSLGVSVCDIGKEAGKLACEVYERIFGKPPPQTKPPECSESRATFYEKCIVSTVVGESGSMRCYPGKASDIREKYKRWPGRVK